MLHDAVDHSRDGPLAFGSQGIELVVSHAKHDLAEPLITFVQRFAGRIPVVGCKAMYLGPVLTVKGLDLAAVDATQRDVRP